MMVREKNSLLFTVAVIAIIGILAAILIPIIGNARASADLSKCMSNYKQIATATINYTQINRGCFPKIVDNAIAQTLSLNSKTGEAVLKAYYWGGDQVGQIDYHILHNFTPKSEPPSLTAKEQGQYTIDFKGSGEIWKCPTLRRDLERLKSGRMGIIFAPHPSKEWSFFNYRQRKDLKDTEAEEKATDVKYSNFRVHAGYDQIPMFAELCKNNRSGEGSQIKPPHNNHYGAAFLDGHVESMDGNRGYLHWCVGCAEHGDVKYTETPDRGVKQ